MAKKRKNRKSQVIEWTWKFPTWLVAFLGGFLACVLLLFCIKGISDPDFLSTLDSKLDKIETAYWELDAWLYGEEEASTIVTLAEGELQVDVIDVGQGESILITTAEKAVLIDAGENDKGDEVLEHLQRRGITELDLAIGTHGHSDHIGGMDTVLANISVDEFWMGVMPDKLVPSTKTYMDVLEQLDVKKIPYREPEVGTQYDLGSGGVLTVLGPQGTPTDLNNCSLVCRVDFGDVSFLFSGDAEESEEKAILASGVDVDVDVMTMGHHGSETSSSSAYFKAASPSYAAISCGANNSYGHPHKATIQKLKNADVLYRRTDINGTITFRTNGKTIEYSSEK